MINQKDRVVVLAFSLLSAVTLPLPAISQDEGSTASGTSVPVIDLPADWDTMDMGDPILLYAVSPPARRDVSYVRDISRESVTISVHQLEEGETSEAYVTSSLDQMRSYLTDFEIVASADTVLLGLPARRIHLTARIESHSLEMLGFWIDAGDRVWTISFGASSQEFDRWRDTFDEMLGSLRLQTSE